MKYLVAAICILLIILGFCTYDLYRIDKCADDIIELLNASQSSADNGDISSAAESVRSAYDMWMDTESYASSVLSHDDLITVSLSLRIAIKSAEISDYNNFSEALTSARFDLEHIIEEEEFLVKNIF
jgi:hypothetical protein